VLLPSVTKRGIYMSFTKKYASNSLGVLDYKGTWNAATNTPALISSTGDKGDYYVVSVAGSTNLDGITDWKPGDWVIFSGSGWQKIDNSETSHPELVGLASDDHLQYLNRNGIRPMTGTLDMASNDLSNVKKISLKTNITTPSYTTATSNGVLTLDANSASVHFITETTPTANFTVVLPNATTLALGTNFELYNRTSSSVFIKYADGTSAGILSREAVSSLILQSNTTTNGIWSPFTTEIAQQAAGVISYTLEQTGAFATTSATNVQITNFLLVPQAGQYFINLNMVLTCSGNNATNYVTIYKNGVAELGTERSSLSSGNNTSFTLTTQGVITVNGLDEIRVYVRTLPASGAAPTLTVSNRSIIALRLGAG